MSVSSDLEIRNIDSEEKAFIQSVYDKVVKLDPKDLENEDFKRGFETAVHDIFETIHTVSQANFEVIGNFINSEDYKDNVPESLTGALEISLIGVRLSILELVSRLLANIHDEIKEPVDAVRDLSKDMVAIENKVFDLVHEIFMNNFSTVREHFEEQFPKTT